MGRTFTKGALGSPWSTEVQSDSPVEIGDADYGDEGPRIAAGVLGKRVTMDVSRNARKGKDRGSDD